MKFAIQTGQVQSSFALSPPVFLPTRLLRCLGHTRSSVSCACIYDVAVASTSLREVHALPPAPNTARDGSVRGHWYTLRGCVVLLVTSRRRHVSSSLPRVAIAMGKRSASAAVVRALTPAHVHLLAEHPAHLLTRPRAFARSLSPASTPASSSSPSPPYSAPFTAAEASCSGPHGRRRWMRTRGRRRRS